MPQSDEIAFLSAAPRPSGKSPLNVPGRNEQFVYTVGRALTFWPVINGNNATWLEEDVRALYDNTGDTNLTFRGKLVNADHQIGPATKKIVIGTIIDEKYIPGVGIDVLNQLDRRCLDAYEIAPDEFAAETGDYSKQSVEIRCDRSKSKFIALTNPGSTKLNDQRIFSADEAASMGMRRTAASDPLGPYKYEGQYTVVEAGVPKRVWGIGILSIPQADRTAVTFDMAASQDYGNLDDIAESYTTTEPCGCPNEMNLSDGAFAIVDGGEEFSSEGGVKKRELPLYMSNENMAAQKPHSGLIKAAVDALNGSPKRYSPTVHAEALKRVRSAHTQSQGDNEMALTAEEKAALVDPLTTEIASLKATVLTAAAEKAAIETNKALEAQSKDNEIAALTAEIVTLKAKIAEDEKAALADTRLNELAKVEGFEIKADEKASLIEALKSDSDSAFRVRVLEATNAGLIKKLANPTAAADELAAKAKLAADEHAALVALGGAAVIVKPANMFEALCK